MKILISDIFQLNVSRNVFEVHNLYIFVFMFSKLFMQICVFLYLVHRIGNFLAHVAALLVACFWGF